MNIKEIQNLIKFISKSGVDEVTIESSAEVLPMQVTGSEEFGEETWRDDFVALCRPRFPSPRGW